MINMSFSEVPRISPRAEIPSFFLPSPSEYPPPHNQLQYRVKDDKIQMSSGRPQDCLQAPVQPTHPVVHPPRLRRASHKPEPSVVEARAVHDLAKLARIMKTTPHYKVVRIGGFDHNPIFQAYVSLPQYNLSADAVGGSKLESRRAAATALLYNIDPVDPFSSLPAAPKPSTTASRLYPVSLTEASFQNGPNSGSRNVPRPHMNVKEEDPNDFDKKLEPSYQDRAFESESMEPAHKKLCHSRPHCRK